MKIHHYIYAFIMFLFTLLAASCGDTSKQANTDQAASTASSADATKATTPSTSKTTSTTDTTSTSSTTTPTTTTTASATTTPTTTTTTTPTTTASTTTTTPTTTTTTSSAGAITASQISAMIQSPIGQAVLQGILADPKVAKMLSDAGISSTVNAQSITTMLENPQIGAYIASVVSQVLSSTSH